MSFNVVGDVNFTNPAQPAQTTTKPMNPLQRMKKKKELTEQQKNIREELKNLNKPQLPSQPASVYARRLAKSVVRRSIKAQDADEILEQIQGLLENTLRIPIDKVDPADVKIVQIKEPPLLSLYYVPLRRNTIIQKDIIQHLYTHKNNFDSLTWAVDGPKLWIKALYKAPTKGEPEPGPAPLPKLPSGVGH
jgi:hypothetical protein